MDEQKLRELIRIAFDTQNPNSNAALKPIRDALNAACELDDFPELTGLEYIWRAIAPIQEVVEREDNPSDHPLASLSYYANGGFFPPPEVLLAVAKAYDLYISKGGDISLEEAFFGAPYKKIESYAYCRKRLQSYLLFHTLWVKMRDQNNELKDASMEVLAEDYLKSVFGKYLWEESVEVDTFLRNYRRWVTKFTKVNHSADKD
jgi:hypothetical protein